MDDSLDYKRMIQKALRDVPRQALEHTQKYGLPGQHHFYITFRTDDPEVRIGSDLLAQFPEEMTIVVQHQFRDLDVGSENFSIGLNFGGVPRSLEIPFRSITAFADPSEEMVLQFEYEPPNESEDLAEIQKVPDEPESKPESHPGGNVVSFDAARKGR